MKINLIHPVTIGFIGIRMLNKQNRNEPSCLDPEEYEESPVTTLRLKVDQDQLRGER